MFGKAIASPEDDPHFQELRRQQRAAHEEIRKNSEVVEQFLRKKKAAESLIGPQGRHHHVTRDDEAKAKAASRAVRAARVKLRDLEMPLRDARAAACRRIVAEVRPEYMKRLGEFALVYLRQRADEIVALERVLAMRAEMNAHQISTSALPMIPPFERSLERTEWKAQVIREDTKALIELGAIKAGDLPLELRKVWGI